MMKRAHAAPAGLLLLIVFLSIHAAGNSGSAVIAIDKAGFDTATHRFNVSWRLDTADLPSGAEAAFSLLCGGAPLPATPEYPFPLEALTGDTSLEAGSLVFDTTYRIGIWVRLQGVWIPPDTSSLPSVHVPEATWEPVRLFTGAVGDTITVLRKRVCLWRDASYGTGIPVHSDTVRIIDCPPARCRGFRKAGIGFRFTDPVALPPSYIGFRPDSLSKSSPSAVIFRDSGGLFLAEHATVRDTARGLIYVKTERFDLPFVVLTDTVAPRVVFSSDTGTTIGSKPVDCSFTLRDNGANCRWKIFSGPGSSSAFGTPAVCSGTLNDTVDKITCQLPVAGAQETGLRALLTIDDGTVADTVNVSRQAVRTRCNQMTMPAGMIMPLAPSAELDSTGCGYALRTLFKNAGGKYDKTAFRIYQWKSSDWMEYSRNNAPRFDFLPGRLYWLITRKEVMIDFGSGRSPSLKDTLVIDLPSRAWTDFSSPYGFPVAFDAIAAATGRAASSLHFYQWSKDEPHRTWRSDPLYSSGVPGLDTPGAHLPFGTNGCFTVYNSSDSTVRLRIPPFPPAQTAAAKSIPHRSDEAWSVVFDLMLGSSITSRAIASASTNHGTPLSIPSPPSFSGPSITVNQPFGGRPAGTLVLPANRHAALTFELTITNPGAASAAVTCTPRPIAGTPDGTVSVGGSRQRLFSPLSMTVDAHGSRTILCRIGAAFGNDRPSSSPESGSEPRIIALSRPTGGRNGLIVRIASPAVYNRIEIIDLAGRRCAVSECHPAGNGGEFIVCIRPAAALDGCRLVRVTAINEAGAVQRRIQKMMMLP